VDSSGCWYGAVGGLGRVWGRKGRGGGGGRALGG
jgi:hypothetical protein